MNSKNISILFITVLLIITATNLLLIFNSRKANYTPPPPDFESNQKIYNEAIKKASKATEAGEYEVAFNHYKTALKYYPGNQGILNKMGILKLQSKKFREAEKIYTDLSTKSPDQAVYKVSLALALLYQYKYEQAALIINQAKSIRTNDSRIHLIDAAVKAQKEDTEGAIQSLKRYPIQSALKTFLNEPFFDPIREKETFLEYREQLYSSKAGKDK